MLLALAIFSLGLQGIRADLHTGLVSYWPLDVDNGGTTTDVSFGNDMTVFNSPVVSAGQRSNAFTFNGTSQYLQRTHGNVPEVDGLPIHLASGGYTIAMWVKGLPQTQANRTVFYQGNSGNNTPAVWLEADPLVTPASNTNKVGVFIRTSGNGTLLNHSRSTNVVWDNTWHHVALVEDHGSVKLYVDGVLDPGSFNYPASFQNIFTLNSTSLGAQITTTGPTRYLSGSIDDVAIWERPLTQAEVQEVRTNGIPTPIPPRPPEVIKSWVGSTNTLGDRAYATAIATGTRPMTYQWFLDGVEQIGVSTNVFVLNNLTAVGTNDITVIMSNSEGSVTNSGPLVILPDPAPSVTNGLVSYWPFDITNSPTATPDLYSHFDMTLTAMTSNNIVTGQFSNALTFNGTSQLARRVGGSSIYSVTNYTVSFWVNGGPPSAANRAVFGEGSTGTSTPALVFWTETGGFLDNLAVFIRNDANYTWLNSLRSTRSVFNSTWHHIVWTDENGKARLYIDGVLDETEFSYPRQGMTLNTTAVGALVRNTTSAYYNGTVDEVATWNRRLTWTEIQQIRTNGIPAPMLPVAPTISVQPLNQTNGVFAGDTVSFIVSAGGEVPLTYQWLSNNVAIPLASNPTAGSNVLTLVNVQPSFSAGYSVVVTNIAGAATSQVAQLAVIPYTPQTTGTVLNLDWGLTGSPNLMPGFTEMNLGMNGTNFNGVKVTLTGIGGMVVERNRTALDEIVTNNPPQFTQAQIYNDLVANSSTADGTGMSVLIERLAPNTQYGLMIWSWSALAPLDRVSDWIETASGSPVTIKSNYIFTTPNAPTNDFDRTFGALLTSSPSGKLQLEGYKNGGTGAAVFINGLRLVAQPTIRITDAQLVGGNIRLTIETQYPDQPISVEEKSNIGGIWGPATGGGIIETHGPIVIADFPASADSMFYRVSSP